MKKHELIELLREAGLKEGRVIRPVSEPFACFHVNDFIVRRAALATRSLGIFWRGDLDLTREREALTDLARQLYETFYVLDEPAAQACAKTSKGLQVARLAVWWTVAESFEGDRFAALLHYDLWHPPRKNRLLKPPMTPGPNWADCLLRDYFPVSGGASQCWNGPDHSSLGLRRVIPVLLMMMKGHKAQRKT